MATTLRLDPETEQALRAEAERTGQSQQDIIREALAARLGRNRTPTSDRDRLIAAGLLRPARHPYRKVVPSLRLPPGVTSWDLLDRDDDQR